MRSEPGISGFGCFHGILGRMAWYLGLDVGGTKTAAALADETGELTRATSGSIKVLRVSPDEAAHNFAALLRDLEAKAGSLRGTVARTCVGSSGISAPVVRSWLQAALGAAVGGELLLLGDEVIALDAAFRGGRGVLAIAGTGSNIVGRAATGELVHTGGWGPALADEGSGQWIGAHALRACFQAIDAAPPSSADRVTVDGSAMAVVLEDLPPLLRAIMERLEARSLDDVIGIVNAPGFNSSTLVPVVAASARGGDHLAAGVLTRAGRDLAGLVGAVARKLEQFEGASAYSPPEVAFTGSVLAHIPEVRDALRETLRAQWGAVAMRDEPVDPLEGALWHARGRG